MTFEHEPGRDAGDAEALIARLVRAARADGPSAAALSAAPAAIATLLAAPAAAALVPAAGTAAHVGKVVASPLALFKWMGVGALATSSALSLVSAAADQPSAGPPERAKATPVRPRPAAAAATGPRLAPQPALPLVPALESPPRPSTTAPRADVAREVAALDAAQRALVDGDPASALRTLAALERMPQRSLAPEATVLSVRALLAQGNTAEARSVAERFCVAAPSSPQAGVLRALIANTEIRTTPSRL